MPVDRVLHVISVFTPRSGVLAAEADERQTVKVVTFLHDTN